MVRFVVKKHRILLLSYLRPNLYCALLFLPLPVNGLSYFVPTQASPLLRPLDAEQESPGQIWCFQHSIVIFSRGNLRNGWSL
ncbi:hypothetical protein C8R47DRAFT_1100547 [Mycena vitilis]|nr:hypothetical protein C8R47DRAFT_1100547 [Mycena vitilis]